MKKLLTKAQAARLAPLWHAKRHADEGWQAAMDLLELDPAMVTGGDLSGESPHLVIAVETQRTATLAKG